MGSSSVYVEGGDAAHAVLIGSLYIYIPLENHCGGSWHFLFVSVAFMLTSVSKLEVRETDD